MIQRVIAFFAAENWTEELRCEFEGLQCDINLRSISDECVSRDSSMPVEGIVELSSGSHARQASLRPPGRVTLIDKFSERWPYAEVGR